MYPGVVVPVTLERWATGVPGRQGEGRYSEVSSPRRAVSLVGPLGPDPWKAHGPAVDQLGTVLRVDWDQICRGLLKQSNRVLSHL